ncbi:MAG TPA: ACP S-malonyltransferase [Planctomycetota bacterium]|nr:ACP S-malonyltransferase [Planctomycetota bacterium]
MTRAAILCPGRGSYTERSLRALPPEHAFVEQAERLRAESALPSLVELDRAARFSPSQHLLPANVSPLIYLVSMLDAESALRDHDVVAVGGNSLGWYTALAVAGALTFEDGFRLVQEMSLLQQEHAKVGGQILYPLVGEDWTRQASMAESVERALASSRGEAFPSIDLGGSVALAGTEAGIAHLLRSLPPVQRGAITYPLRLLQHGPYHTPLVQEVQRRAQATLSRLEFRAPRTTLVDGRGKRFTPWSTDVAELLDYTLGEQIVAPFSFHATVRNTLRELAPDRLVLPGPGNTLGGVCGQILALEGWRGIHTKADFERVQASDQPIVVSMRR